MPYLVKSLVKFFYKKKVILKILSYQMLAKYNLVDNSSCILDSCFLALFHAKLFF